MWMIPPQYVVLDIETIAGDPTEAEEWMRRVWAPNPNWKPGTIGQRFLDALEKKREQLALLDSAPIISLALRTPSDCRLLHWLDFEEPAVSGVPLERCQDQTAMLRRAAEYFALCSPETVLVGHNVLRFDLPKLRLGMLRHDIALPQCLVWRDQPVFDTMREWSRFTLDERQYVGLAELLETCGLVDHKKLASGAMVPELYREGRYAEIVAYAIADVLAEWNLFLRMTGQAGDTSLDSGRQQPPKAMDNSPGNPTPICPAAKVVGPPIRLPDDAQAADRDIDALVKEFEQ